MAASDLDQVIESYHAGLGEFMKGNAEPGVSFYSRREDVTLGNPFGPFARGQREVRETAGRAASNYREGGAVGFDRVATCVTPALAYIVEVERYQAKVGGSADLARLALRVTSIFRPEDGTWKLVHRHADPITAVRPAGSVVQSPS